MTFTLRGMGNRKGTAPVWKQDPNSPGSNLINAAHRTKQTRSDKRLYFCLMPAKESFFSLGANLFSRESTMKQNKISYLLTGCLTLAGAGYLPEAAASTLLTPAAATVIDNTVGVGQFSKIYDFVIDDVYDAYNLSGAVSFQNVQTLVSLTTDFSNATITSTNGISSASVELLDATSAVIATGSLTSFSVASTPTLVNLPFPNVPPFYQELLTTFNLI